MGFLFQNAINEFEKESAKSDQKLIKRFKILKNLQSA
jgi:hypothetical protein